MSSFGEARVPCLGLERLYIQVRASDTKLPSRPCLASWEFNQTACSGFCTELKQRRAATHPNLYRNHEISPPFRVILGSS